MAYQFSWIGGFYQYLMAPPSSWTSYTGTPFVIRSPIQISETQLESIASVLAGGTPPSGWEIQKDDPPVTTKTY
jgi:hypothetical protein